MEFRRSGRFTPSTPVTVVVADDEANELTCAVVTELSTNGARIRGPAALPVGATLRFAIHFAAPPGECELTGRVAWAYTGRPPLPGSFHHGIEWQCVGESPGRPLSPTRTSGRGDLPRQSLPGSSDQSEARARSR
jgi:hypothetical protein